MAGMNAEICAAWMREAARLVGENADRLTELDTAIGDGDHGVNLRRGFDAAVAALAGAEEGTVDTPGAVLKAVGTALVNVTGGASGPLYGTFFRKAAKEIGDDPELTVEELREALAEGLSGVRALGGANEGDKTMVDTLSPAIEAFGGADLPEAARNAYAAAAEGCEATKGLTARKGRASYLGERSAGHVDPGAASAVLVFEGLAVVLGGKES